MEVYHESVTPTDTLDPCAIGPERRLSRERISRAPRKYETVVMLPIGRVLEAICEHCEPGGTIKPGVRKLAAWADCSPGSISGFLYQLEADGHIRYDGPSGCITRCIDPDEPLPSSPPAWQATPGGIYLLKCGDAYKIGCSTDVRRRIAELSLPYKELICVVASADMYRDEAAIHALFRAKQLNREWFTLDEADVAWFTEQLADSSLITRPTDEDESTDQAADRDQSDDQIDQQADRDQSFDRIDQDVDRDQRVDRVESISPLISAVRRRLPHQDAERESDQPVDRFVSTNGHPPHTPPMVHETHEQQQPVVVLSTESTNGGSGGSARIDQRPDHPAALILRELGADDAIIADALTARPDLTPEQVRARWAYDEQRIAQSGGRLTVGVFFHAIRRGQLAPRDPLAAIDPAEYRNQPGFLVGDDDQDGPGRDPVWERALALAPPGLDGLSFEFLLVQLAQGASDEQALDALELRLAERACRVARTANQAAVLAHQRGRP